MPKSLKNMSDDELMDAWTEASKVAEEAQAKTSEYASEYNRRAEENVARERYESMTEAERAALAQVMHTEGIESQEAVNE